jgi:branched-chain amino acid aminotransferase
MAGPKGKEMLHAHIFHNGKLQRIEESRLSPGQAGLFTGWGLFTTLRLTQGLPFAFERHWARLEKDSARTLCPLPFGPESVREQVIKLARVNGCREGAARIYSIYNRVGAWRSAEEFPEADLLVCTVDLPGYREPARLALRPHGRHAASPLAGVKVTSWLGNVWCLQEAQKEGYDEALLLNEVGEVAECTAANAFCVREGKVLTPPLSSGCLEGVTRSVLLEMGLAEGVSVEERTLMPEDFFEADEVFISSTNRNLLAVGEISGHEMARAPGPVVQKLEAAFVRYIARYIAERAAIGSNA